MQVWGTPVLASVEEIIYDLRAVLQLNGIDLLKDIVRRNDTGLMVTCIAHKDGQENKPSCGISLVDVERPDKTIPAGTVHCFTCDYSADLAKFVSDCFGYKDGGLYGYKWITQNYVNLAIEYREPLLLNMDRKVNSVQEDVNPLVTEDELMKYRFFHPYMYERRLTYKVIQYFDIGYDRETDCITFPVADKDGRVLFVQRRSVRSKFYSFPPDDLSGRTLFGLDKIYKNLSWIKEVIVTESIIDALTCWVFRRPAVAQFRALPTDNQIKLLKELPVRQIVEALDSDEAGRKGANKLRRGLGSNKLLTRLVLPPGIKDLNEAPDEFIQTAQPMLF